ncbi:hypothetical protein [Helicobacter didelphidarum]|uniref:hypothetical protein n=1 Tax=Helicobacter didelphidarum TaxID=2040648 RepID=UPI0015F19237|nr:hypothetical protein [Helicobacter didelphidarum]
MMICFWINNNCFTRANTDTRASVDSITRIVNRHTDNYQERVNSHTRIKNANIFQDFE